MAARYWVGGNATWDATAGTKWALTSGGAGGQAVPTSADDVFLDNGVGTGNVTTATSTTICTCKSFTCTGYTGTLTVNGTIRVAGSVTLVSAMTITTSAGTPILSVTATGTLTSNTKVWPYQIAFSGAPATTFTFADNWTAQQTVTMAATCVYNGNTLNMVGLTGACNTSGTTTFNFNGTGTWNTTVGTIINNTTINTAGTLTISGTVLFGNATLTYTAGTVTHTGTLTLTNSTLATNGMTWNNITNTSGNVTLTNNLTCSGIYTQGNTILNGSTLTCLGSFFKTSGNSSGTTSISMTGTGTISTPGTINNPFTINTAGTITFSGTCSFGNNSWTYTAGTIAVSGTPILNFNLNTPTVTLNSLFTFLGTIQTSVSTSFAGTNGFNINAFICNTAGRTITLKDGNTYSILNSLTTTATLAQHIIITSSDITNVAYLVLQQGATQDNGFLNGTRIDSSGGQTIYTRKGTLSNTSNWRLLVAPLTIGVAS